MSSIEALSDSEYETLLNPVWRYLVIDDKPQRSDVIFVFGGLDLSVPARAAQLFHAGMSKHILITGNVGPLSKNVFVQPEAYIFRDEMIKSNVPQASIIVEDVALNTLENVVFGMRALYDSKVNVNSAILIAKPFLIRRCVATFQRHHKEVAVLSCPPQGPILKFCDRPRREFAERILAELQRIKTYSEKGDIVPQILPKEVENSTIAIKNFLSGSEN